MSYQTSHLILMTSAHLPWSLDPLAARLHGVHPVPRKIPGKKQSWHAALTSPSGTDGC